MPSNESGGGGNPAGLHGVIEIGPERAGALPVFVGTGVPVKNLFEAIKAGHSIAAFVREFPGVTRAQVEAVLDAAEREVLEHARWRWKKRGRWSFGWFASVRR
jgi:uncharacterized protein (DUF433 family)